MSRYLAFRRSPPSLESARKGVAVVTAVADQVFGISAMRQPSGFWRSLHRDDCRWRSRSNGDLHGKTLALDRYHAHRTVPARGRADVRAPSFVRAEVSWMNAVPDCNRPGPSSSARSAREMRSHVRSSSQCFGRRQHVDGWFGHCAGSRPTGRRYSAPTGCYRSSSDSRSTSGQAGAYAASVAVAVGSWRIACRSVGRLVWARERPPARVLLEMRLSYENAILVLRGYEVSVSGVARDALETVNRAA